MPASHKEDTLDFSNVQTAVINVNLVTTIYAVHLSNLFVKKTHLQTHQLVIWRHEPVY